MDTVTNTYKLISEYKLWSLSHEESYQQNLNC